MGVEGELLRNLRSFFSSAELVRGRGEHTGAFILFFKSLLALCDYVLLTKGKGLPKDHSERFRSLEKHFPDMYREVDYLFKYYQQSYSTSVRKEVCDEAKKSVVLFAKNFGIKVVE